MVGSPAVWVEFCFAREDDGRTALEGAGELRATFAISVGKLPTTGDPVTDGDMTALVRLERENIVSARIVALM